MAFDKAVALANTAAEAAHIRMQIDRLVKNAGAAQSGHNARFLPRSTLASPLSHLIWRRKSFAAEAVAEMSELGALMTSFGRQGHQPKRAKGGTP